MKVLAVVTISYKGVIKDVVEIPYYECVYVKLRIIM